MRKQKILWDMDGVLAQLIESLIEHLNIQYPDSSYEMKHAIAWNFWEHLINREAGAAALAFMHSENFFLNLKPYQTSVETFKKMIALGHEVVICTAPLAGKHQEQSMAEKTEWVKRHIGPEYAENILFVFNKTEVPADVIIDDKPGLTIGHDNIQFKNWLIVDHPYNQHLPHMEFPPVGRIKLDWSNWEEEFRKLELI